MNQVMTTNLLVFAAVLFSIGLVGFLTRRSLILMFLSLEMMLAGVSINLIAFSKHYSNYQGQVLAVMVLSIAACEAAIALALVVSLYRRKATLDVKAWDELSETLVPKEIESPVTIAGEHKTFPTLTPSGLDPIQSPMPVKFSAEQGTVEAVSVAGEKEAKKMEAPIHA